VTTLIDCLATQN
jgi:formate hydrogenlyase transcriptional activator